MTKKIHFTKNAPAAVGPYSQAVEIDGWMFCSGQVSINPRSQEVYVGDVAEQAKMVMENIKAVLASADLTLDNVIKSTIFLTDMSDFAKVNEVYGGYFKKDPPARSTIQVAGLPKGVNVEVEVIARRF